MLENGKLFRIVWASVTETKQDAGNVPRCDVDRFLVQVPITGVQHFVDQHLQPSFTHQSFLDGDPFFQCCG